MKKKNAKGLDLKVKINKIKIIEESTSIINRKYVYHVGGKGYSEIKPGGMVRSEEESEEFRKKHDLSKEFMKKYNTEISSFLAPVTKDMVKILRSKGFSNWGDSELYLYKIDITQNPSIRAIKITSVRDAMPSHDANKELSISNFLNIDNDVIQDWSDNAKWFKYNSIHGNKRQYASCIPHAQIYTKTPLKFKEVTRII